MDLKGLMLSEISQRITNIICLCFYVASKNKTKLEEKQVKFIVTRERDGVGGQEE